MATTDISTIRASGGDYSSLSAWEAGEQGNLVTLDRIAVAECYNDWLSGLDDLVNIDGWTSDSTRYIRVTVAEGHRHDGTPGSGFFLTKASTSDFTSTLRINSGFAALDGLEVRQTSTSGSYRHAIALVSSGYLTNCLSMSKAGRGFSIGGFGARAVCCLAYDTPALAGFNAANNSISIYNCVSSGCGTGFTTEGSSSLLSNSVAFNCTTGASGTWNASSTNNASSAASGMPGANAVYSVTSAAFTDAASKDLHLSEISVLRGAGANLYSYFQTDIDGDTWPSSGAWDIGFDYYVAAGPSYPTLGTPSITNITSSSFRVSVGLT